MAQSESTERYSAGYSPELVASFQDRTVAREAAFLLSRLKSGMNVLDCGSGPGTITVGLAQAVAPGIVQAIDISAGQVAVAQKHAAAHAISNVEFRVANAYSLPFADNFFDAALAHAVLQHLRSPEVALREIHRVLKPGGVLGVRDDDQGSLIIAPPSAEMTSVIDALKDYMRSNGGDPEVGRRHRQLLRAAGFGEVIASASVEYDGTHETTRRRGSLAATLLRAMSESASETAYTAAELHSLAEVARQWGDDPNAFDAIIWCEAIGVKADG